MLKEKLLRLKWKLTLLPLYVFSVPVLSTSLSHFSAFYSSVIYFCSCFSTISTFIPLLICPYPSFHAPPHSLSPSPSHYLFLSISLHTSLSHFSNPFSQSYPSVYPSLNLLSTGNGFFPKKGGGGVKKGFILSQTKRSVCESSKNTEKKRKGDNNQKPSLIRLSHTHILFSPSPFLHLSLFSGLVRTHTTESTYAHLFLCMNPKHIAAHLRLHIPPRKQHPGEMSSMQMTCKNGKLWYLKRCDKRFENEALLESGLLICRWSGSEIKEGFLSPLPTHSISLCRFLHRKACKSKYMTMQTVRLYTYLKWWVLLLPTKKTFY